MLFLPKIIIPQQHMQPSVIHDGDPVKLNQIEPFPLLEANNISRSEQYLSSAIISGEMRRLSCSSVRRAVETVTNDE
jgi:hypothetical protein